jgi:hypothetical protein
MPKMYAETQAGLYVKSPLILPDFNQRWNISTHFNKTLSI